MSVDEDNTIAKLSKVRRLLIKEEAVGEEQFFKGQQEADAEVTSADLISGFDLSDLDPENINSPAIKSKIKPFSPAWSYGFNPRSPVINISGDDRTQILFTTSHLCVIYDYKIGTMTFLEGHQGEIIAVAADGNLKYIVTADETPTGGDNCLIVWDLKAGIPLLTIFNMYPKSGTLLTRMSRNANYIITLGFDGEYYLLDYWIWSQGNEKPDSTYKVHCSNGPAKKICINPADEARLMIVFEKAVFFVTINLERNELIEMAVPPIPPTLFPKTGYFTHGVLVKHSHKQFTSTSKGFICVFANSLVHKDEYDENETDSGKVFINAVKITNEVITCMRQTSGMLMIGTAKGQIFFFDNRVRILYWLKTPDEGDIRSISFDFVPRRYRTARAKRKTGRRHSYFSTYGEKTYRHEPEKYEIYSDKTTEIETVVNQFNIRTAATLDQKPFVIKNFIVATSCCNIFQYDYCSDKFTLIFDEFDGEVTAIEANYVLPHLVIGFKSGRITLIHHESNKTITTILLPKAQEEEKGYISSIKFAPNSFHLVCGRANGEVWILETVLLKPKTQKPLKGGDSKINKIRFSSDSTQFAYMDDEQFVYLFILNRETQKWVHKGRIRSHYKEIRDILFYPDPKNSVLCTIGADRYITEYNNLYIASTDFEIKSRERVFQSSTPNCCTTFCKNINGELMGYFLIADDQNKYVTAPIDTKTIRSVVLGPAYGCFKHQTVHKMKIIDSEPNIMIFMTKRHMGLQILPADGNPYKYVGYLVHPVKLHNFVVSADGKYIFTLGMFDKYVMKWEVITKSVKILQLMGGKELDGYYCLLEGGRNGWIFQEMLDLFYYMQILEQGENYAMPRIVLDTISIGELPDLVRACGFFPTDYEIENMILDIKYRDFDEKGIIKDEINFSEFVKLFINHKPAYGYKLEDIKSAFKILVQNTSHPSTESFHKAEFIDFLTSSGEPIPLNHLKKCFQILLRIKDVQKTNWLPNEIFYDTLVNDILGIVQDSSTFSTDELNIAMTEEDEESEEFDTDMMF